MSYFDHLREPGSDDSDASDDSTSGAREVNLRLVHLESYHGRGEGDASQFAQNGVCPKRIKKLLNEKDGICECGCKIPFSILHKTCQSFWSLDKRSQDALLWSLQSGSGRKSTWSIEGGVQFNSKIVVTAVK